MNKITLICLALIFLSGQRAKQYDLAIINASILEVKSGNILPNRTILIANGQIEKIVVGDGSFTSRELIDAKGRLVSPGFIDTHIHPADVFGDYENAPVELPEDSLGYLRKKLSDHYLPYGTTTVLTMGQPEKWLKPLLDWYHSPQPEYVDLFVSGGALISGDNRTPYIGHTEVLSLAEARQKVFFYHEWGIRHLKVYYRLKEPEFSGVMQLGDSLQMKIYGHIGDYAPGYLRINDALERGLKHFEHLLTIPVSLIKTQEDRDLLNEQFHAHFGERNNRSRMLEFYLETFRFVEENKQSEMDSLIHQIAKNKVTFSTTLYLLFQEFQDTHVAGATDSTLSEKQISRCLENFRIAMKYTKAMYERGIEIRLGSDCYNGGKANIAELILLCRYGFSVADVFRIATLNGAKAMGIESEAGTIEIGKKANLILWSKNPFDNYENFCSEITVIKDGVPYKE